MSEWVNLKNRLRLELTDKSYLVFGGAFKSLQVKTFKQSGLGFRLFALILNACVVFVSSLPFIYAVLDFDGAREEFLPRDSPLYLYFATVLLALGFALMVYVHVTSFMWMAMHLNISKSNKNTPKGNSQSAPVWRFVIKIYLWMAVVLVAFMLCVATYAALNGMDGGKPKVFVIELSILCSAIIGLVLLRKKS